MGNAQMQGFQNRGLAPKGWGLNRSEAQVKKCQGMSRVVSPAWGLRPEA